MSPTLRPGLPPDGVEIFLDEAMHTNYADVQEGEKVVIPLSTLEFVPGGNSIWINGGQGCTTLGVKPLEKINIEQCTSSADSHADIMLADDINFFISLNAPWRGLWAAVRVSPNTKPHQE